MKRGDVVLVAEGKPRPAVIVQADAIPTPGEILICPLTTELIDAPIYRLPVEPHKSNGLKAMSQLMVDKVGPARRGRIDRVIGQLSATDLAGLDAALLTLLDLTGD
jgi:mRNA interferase MazF